MADEVGDRDRVGDVVGDGAVAAVGDRPLGASDGRRAVLAGGLELALGAGVQQLEDLARGRGGRGVARLLLAALLAERVARGALERALDERERDQSLAGSARSLVELEYRAAERALLGLDLWLVLLAVLAAASWAPDGPPPAAVISWSVPCSALIRTFCGICRNWVKGTNTPLILTRTTPLTGAILNVWPRVGWLGGGAGLVVNVVSGPNVVPALLDAISLT